MLVAGRHERAMSDRIRFLLAGAVHEVAGVAPTTTVLDRTNLYLWVHLRGRGFLCEATKELEIGSDCKSIKVK